VSPARFGGEIWLTDERVAVARTLDDFERVLDFGCGCGRLLRHLGQVADRVQIHGADIDSEMIEWLRANVPFARFDVTAPEPPLPYPDKYFDLIISHSVFTHLDEGLQDVWLAELQRVTRPDGILLLSVNGQSGWRRTREDAVRAGQDVDPWEAELESRGILFIPADAFVGSTHPEFYHSTIHAPWYIFGHWSQYFEIDAYLPDGAWALDLIVLRRRVDRAASSAPPTRHRLEPPPAAAAHRISVLGAQLRDEIAATCARTRPDLASRQVERSSLPAVRHP
jgi:SAM-dependent methyltransferase